MLIALRGRADVVNRTLLLKAFEVRPALVLDCGNVADPHRLFSEIPEEQLHDVYVMNAEAIYRFRDALRQIPGWAGELGARQIIVTTIHALFSYDDDEENRNVLEHCWQLMQGLQRPVYVGIAQDTMHEVLAETYAEDIWDIQ